ncbi:efflux RND transporter periplasmic adaptor subunit [Brucella gallinifaecis]|uniref:Efflux RND transporter periplasmic adaptor subunit n=1 Tax=Brucella gallinifaecis TaxID=215590 RepID=A0A502BQD6_9HYPH|nr:efflux RND transporter periplasmic adaptor subunit [Brucella gallinifaecis]TPF75861.1 efflux RND transporter periplasmic adaptor subunit [Brucella gallinifaecis]
MIKRLILAIIFLVIVVGGLVGFNLFRDKAIKDFFANMKQPAQTVSTITVSPSSWTPGIEAIGTANAKNGVDLTVQLSGIVQNIGFKANQDVKQGDLLLELENSIEKAELAAAKAESILADQNLKRAQSLRSSGFGTVSDADTTEATARAKKAAVVRSQAVLDQKFVVAPFSGTIGIAKIDLGQYLTPGTVIATLQQIDTMRVDFTIPELSLPNIRLGQTIKLGQNMNSLNFTGVITGIDPKIDPSTRLVSVRAEVENPDHKLTPGQFLQVRVELPTENDVITLPQTTIVSSLYGDYVFVVRPAEKKEGEEAPEADSLIAHQVFVKVGRRFGEVAEITSGIKDGDIVITAGQNKLSAGMSVKIDNSVNPIPAADKK